MIIDEVAFGSVTMQMQFAHVKMAAIHGSLQDAEIIFDRVGVPEIRTDVFLGAVVDGAMTTKLRTNRPVDRSIVSHQIGGLIDVRDDDRLQGLRGHVGNVEAADFAATLD